MDSHCHQQRRLHDFEDSSDSAGDPSDSVGYSSDSAGGYQTEDAYIGCFSDDDKTSLLNFGFISADTTVEVRRVYIYGSKGRGGASE